MTKIISMMAGEEDFTELLQEFVSEIPERISRIETAIATEDVASLKRIVHQLKGACGGYGFPSLTDEAFQLEKVIDSRVSTAQFESEIDRFISNLRLMSADSE